MGRVWVSFLLIAFLSGIFASTSAHGSNEASSFHDPFGSIDPKQLKQIKKLFSYEPTQAEKPMLVGILSGNPPYALIEIEEEKWVGAPGSSQGRIKILKIEGETVTIQNGSKREKLMPDPFRIPGE